MHSDIVVSVSCMTYNHESYIRDCLEGFVNQKTNFKFEVIVHDDASTDKTADIVREYEKKYPDIIKPIYQTENQHSRGINKFKTFVYPVVKGEYIALCEGDDYWIDENKLQKQFDAMQLHPEVDICSHRAIMVEAATKIKIKDIAPKDSDTVITVSDVILGDGDYVATNSLFYRKSMIDKDYKFYKQAGLDYSLQIAGSLRGGMLYLNDSMSAYRIFSIGSWSERIRKNPQMRYQNCTNVISMLNTLNEETQFEYDKAILHMISKYESVIFLQQKKFRKLFTKRYIRIYMNMPLRTKISLFLRAYFPWIVRIKKAIRNEKDF